MIYSKTCEYAIRALSFLSTQPKGEYVLATKINEETGVPKPYLSKICQNLVKEGILVSLRGPHGGFTFKKDPKDVSLKKVVTAIDDFTQFDDCVMGLDQCNSKNACPLHHVWAEAKENIIKKLETISIADVTKKTKKVEFRGLRRHKLNLVLKNTLLPSVKP